MREITVNASMEQIKSVTDFVNGILAELGCSDRERIQIDIAVDEIFGNIVRYAYVPKTGPVTVRAEMEKDPPGLILTFIDRGMPFDPLEVKQPDTTSLPLRKRPIGGLGLYMVKKTMDTVSYRFLDGQNILTIRKKI